MRTRIQPFSHYLELGHAREVGKNISAARSSIEMAQKRLGFFTTYKVDNNNATFIFEGAYEVMRECAQCLMFAEGYKSESHEATIAFVYDRFRSYFNEKLIFDLDRFRRARNDAMYHSGYITEEEAIKALLSAEEFHRITISIFNAKYYKN